ncbi:DUF4238 domain-containing protein [Burkholderia ubonensis]|uniref:DUF4238 domain-containing protein n=1 Tax=Burkholderia ubonensis TaxID=101571 RepID=A0ABD4E6C0_9BURK|nr:DUF4238 domain-containing protein [Burkholderia ubonensis]KVN89260.1 hypothetical protein WJ68_04095 [Burkholderia ubonensis]KVZ55747.1 hypothetical protein WL19_00080 [Burkholderia ubonensis]KVZ89508.1 hypothetical protein WL24_04700 [Burkholderia ubonensis]
MGKSHKKQHYVPASYLKAWCDPDRPATHEPYVWVFERDGTSRHRRAPHKLFTETDMYTIETADGGRDLCIEATLSMLEDRFTRMRISKFNHKRPLTPEEHVYLCTFVAAAQFRTAASRDHHASQWQNVLKIADDLAAKVKSATAEQRESMARISELSSGEGQSFTHEQVRELAAKPLQKMMAPVLRTTVPILLRMDLAIYSTSDETGFITSDRPCTWFDPEAYKMPPFFRSPALGSETIEVTMPISPQQCLCLNWQGYAGYLDASKLLLDEFNRRHRFHCKNQYVVRNDLKNDYWFYEQEIPDDAWEKRHTGASAK